MSFSRVAFSPVIPMLLAIVTGHGQQQLKVSTYS